MRERDPKPFTPAQRRRLVQAARKHRKLAPVLEGRGRALHVEPHIAARGGPAAQAIVSVYDYDRDRTLVATIDAAKSRVLSVDEASAQPQLSDEEREEAESLAAADERVRKFLRRRKMRPLTRLYFQPEGPRHRYAIVFLRPTTSERAYAVVDLSERRVVDVMSRKEFTG
jgi:Cu2+-containing amine oxidase